MATEIKRVDFGDELEVKIPSEKVITDTKIYLAGPLGFAESTRPFHNRTVELIQLMGGEAIDPWKLMSKQEIQSVSNMPYGQERKDAWASLNLDIGWNNILAINKANGVIANLDGVDVDSGTAAEIGYAFGRGILIIGYRGDFRLSADNEGSSVNLQVETFIRMSGKGSRLGNVVTSIRDLPSEILRVWGK